MNDIFPARSQKPFFAVSAVVLIILVVAFTIINPVSFTRKKNIAAVKVHYADHISPAHQRVIDEFNRLNAGRIEVVPVNLPFEKFSTNERKELLARSLRSKSDRLDIFSVDYIWVPRFAKWAEPLDKYFSTAEISAIIPQALEPSVFMGKFYAMPLYIDIGLMYYRRDIIRRLPDADVIEEKLRNSISWTELLQLRVRLGYNGKPFYIFQGNDYEGLVCNYFEQAAGMQFSQNTRMTLDLQKPEMKTGLQWLVDLIYRYRISPKRSAEFTENTSYRFMLENDAVFVRGWPNFIENFEKLYADTAKLRLIGRAALPHHEGKPSRSVFGGWNLMISRTSAKKAEALEFIRFLQTERIQKLLFETAGFIPIVQNVYRDSVFMRSHPELVFYRKLLENGFHRPALINYTKISDILSFFACRALRREITADAAIDRASEMISSQAVTMQ